MRPLAIRTRLVVFWMSALAVILVLFSVITYGFFQRRLDSEAEEEVTETFGVLTMALERADGRLVWNESVAGEDTVGNSLHDSLWTIAVDRGDGREPELFRASKRWNRNLMPPQRLDAPYVKREIGNEPYLLTQRVEAVNLSKQNGGKSELVFTVAYPMKESRDTLVALIETLAISSLIVWSLMLAASVWLVKGALKPLSTLARQTEIIDAGNISTRLQLPPDAPADEVAQLARQVNACLERLETAFQQQRRFTSDASHELRTPLSIISGEIEVAMRRERSADDLRLVLERANKQVQRLTQLVEKLLFLSRAQDQQIQIESLQVEKLVAGVSERWSSHPRWPDVVVDVDSKVRQNFIKGHEALLAAMLDNLMDNAAKYSPDATPIRLEVRHASSGEFGAAARNASVERGVLFSFCDDGPGVPAEDVPHLFQPFYRSHSARASNKVGAGLGLAIVGRISRLLGGCAFYQPGRNGHGAVFSLLIPDAV